MHADTDCMMSVSVFSIYTSKRLVKPKLHKYMYRQAESAGLSLIAIAVAKHF